MPDNPSHAVSVWFNGDAYIVEHAGQLYTFSPTEPSRLTAFLAALWRQRDTLLRSDPAEEGRLRFQAAWREKGAEIRAHEEQRKEREKAALVRRADRAARLKEAERLLAMVGL